MKDWMDLILERAIVLGEQNPGKLPCVVLIFEDRQAMLTACDAFNAKKYKLGSAEAIVTAALGE